MNSITSITCVTLILLQCIFLPFYSSYECPSSSAHRNIRHLCKILSKLFAQSQTLWCDALELPYTCSNICFLIFIFLEILSSHQPCYLLKTTEHCVNSSVPPPLPFSLPFFPNLFLKPHLTLIFWVLTY